MQECIICKIVSREIPSHLVYEDEKTMAIMDIHPIQNGHVLVFPKTHTEAFEQMSPDEFSEVMGTVHKVANRIKNELNPPRVGVILEGFDIPHVHVKTLPINNEVELRNIPDMQQEPDHDALGVMAERLKVETN